MASPLPMKSPVPIAPPSPIRTIWVWPRSRLRPLSRWLIETRFPVSVIVGDAGIVAGADHADDVETLGGSRLERVQLLARQEDHIARPHPCPAILRPETPLPGEYDDRFLVEVAMGRGLRLGNVPDELRDDLRADALIDEELEVAGPGRLALCLIDRDHSLAVLR